MRLGAVQMTSSDDVGANLRAAEPLIADAAAQGADLIALPENFAYLRREGVRAPCAQRLDGEIVAFLRECARRHARWILGGTFPEDAGDGRVFNTSVLLSPEGVVEAVYRKIHLFDVDLRAQGGAEFRESAAIAPGQDVVTAKTPFGGVGLSVCYDVRFPELYRALAFEHGAEIVVVPAAFTAHTGAAHWHVLLRARAIENQCYVVAAGQIGDHEPGRTCFGRSMIIDPWGTVI
ncbi:MAG TPA: carbon-nitrogen hydrolase family protein, partial [Myxococcota bacterium]|nr:carbon-nitrogen hydrolase family protein [Myxococcota bacterium]